MRGGPGPRNNHHGGPPNGPRGREPWGPRRGGDSRGGGRNHPTNQIRTILTQGPEQGSPVSLVGKRRTTGNLTVCEPPAKRPNLDRNWSSSPGRSQNQSQSQSQASQNSFRSSSPPPFTGQCH